MNDEVEIQVMEYEGKKYFLFKTLKENKNTYYYFSNIEDNMDYLILKDDLEDDSNFVTLDSDEEERHVLELIARKLEENI